MPFTVAYKIPAIFRFARRMRIAAKLLAFKICAWLFSQVLSQLISCWQRPMPAPYPYTFPDVRFAKVVFDLSMYRCNAPPSCQYVWFIDRRETEHRANIVRTNLKPIVQLFGKHSYHQRRGMYRLGLSGAFAQQAFETMLGMFPRNASRRKSVRAPAVLGFRRSCNNTPRQCGLGLRQGANVENDIKS